MCRKKMIFFTFHLKRVLCLFLFFTVFLLSTCFAFMTYSDEESCKGGKLAIVIDDFGLQREGVAQMLGLECKLTVAIMPFLEHTEDDAEDALENGKEVIIHVPMQASYHDPSGYLGPRPIRVTDTEETIKKWVDDAVLELPEAKGANIHMGTLCSSKEYIMQPLLEALNGYNHYFVDSKTSGKSVCREVAGEIGISFYENHVFLEHEQKNKQYVKKCLTKAMEIAQKRGQCIAIGHVGHEGGRITVQAIHEMLPAFHENNIELVFVSELRPLDENK